MHARAHLDPRATPEGSKQTDTGRVCGYQQNIYHNFELTCSTLQHLDNNSITIVDRSASPGSSPKHATKPYMHKRKVLRDWDDDDGELQTLYMDIAPSVQVDVFPRPWRRLLAPSNDSIPSSVSTRTASRTWSDHVFAPPSMPVVMHYGVQRDVDGGDDLLFPLPLRVIHASPTPTPLESSSDEALIPGISLRCL